MKAGVALALIIAIVIVFGILLGMWQSTQERKAKVALATSGNSGAYRDLVDEYRKLADMAITAQEHTDLKLADVGTQLALLREELRSVQRILEDVE